MNVVIAAVLGGLLANVSVAAGVAAVAVSLVLIYLRGYLVPYTPTLTKRYLPDRVLGWFDKAPPDGTGGLVDDGPREADTDGRTGDGDDAEPVEVERVLVRLGVVTECEGGTDLCLEPSFRRAWREHVSRMRRDDSRRRKRAVEELLGLDPDGAHELTRWGEDAVVINIDGRKAGQWESEAALLADLAADATLREWTDGWDDLDVRDRSGILNALRMFVERCPDCGASVSMGQESVESCCRSYDVAAVSCDGCGARLFELRLPEELRGR